jgi:glutaredoxin
MVMRLSLWLAMGAGAAAWAAFDTSAARADRPVQPDIEFFVHTGCPHCARARAFLSSLQSEQPHLRIVERDAAEPEALRRLVELAQAQGIEPLGVPAFWIRGTLLIGFDQPETTGRQIRRLLAALSSATPRDSAVVRGAAPAPSADVIETPVLGPLSASRLGLPLFTVLVGLVDGFNPCAMWALVYILSLLVNLQSRTRMFLVGATFVAVAGLLYYGFMAAWLEVFRLIGFSRTLQAALGGTAVLVGLVNLKDFWAFGRGFSLGIPSAARQPLYARMRRVLTAENLAGALVAVTILSVMVNVVELLCTAGLPAVYTQILSALELPPWRHHAYLGLYTAAYVLDDSLVLGIATMTLSRRRLQERGGRWLKLLSGAVMLVLGATLLVKPEWLS